MSSTAPGHWASAPERSNLTSLRLMRWIALTFGRRVTRLLLHPITLYFLLAAPRVRAQSLLYLGRALGRKAGWVDVYAHVHCFASTILDRVYLLSGQLDGITLHAPDMAAIDAAASSDEGACLVGAHLGSFEALAALGRARGGLRIAMAMYPDNARRIHSVLAAIAPEAMAPILTLGRPASMLLIRDWLVDGGLVGLLADRAAPVESQQRSTTRRLPFLGAPAPFNDGPLRLAALLRTRVVFMAALYAGGGRYDIVFETLADFRERDTDTATREQRIAAAQQAYVERLEALCRAYPNNWFNFHDFWQDA